MSDATNVLNELTGGEPDLLFANRPVPYGGQEFTKRLRRLVHAGSFELTLYLPRRGLRTLAQAARKTDTMLGHAVASSSYGAANHALLVAIATKVGVDVPTVLAPYVDDPIVDDPK